MNSQQHGIVRDVINGVIHLWWIFVIVMPLTAFGLYLAVDHANANQQRSQARANRQFRQSQIEANRKFRQSIEISSRQTAYSINKSVCVLRTIAQAQIGRLELTKATGYKEAEAFWQQILDNQVPVPATFDCKTLPKKPPKAPEVNP